MLTDTQLKRMFSKLERFEDILEPMIFVKKAHIGAVKYETARRLYEIPSDDLFVPAPDGSHWGGEETFCWYKTEFVVPEELDGQDLFIKPHTQGYESLLWVDGKPFGTFATKIVFTGHGNHYCDLLRKNAKAGDKIEIALEVYSGHAYKGCAPLENNPILSYDYIFNGIDICVKDWDISDFYFDLRTINELYDILPEESFRKGDIANALYEVNKCLYCSYEDTDDETFREALNKAHPYLKEVLAVKSGPEAAQIGITGHSHMDTAWLWMKTETIKKCARTYSNQLALMEQYPEYKFVQSSACHGNMILEHYPELFERIKQKVKEGKYEPNGGVWVECDCNITSGESMVRQFLWGQRFTRKHFDFTSNTFWLPDTFGYSAAIPQIMKGCGVDYFCTTKLDWNDTNVFPYDTFWWEGLDGTKVFTHFNRTHCFPSPRDLNNVCIGKNRNGNTIKERNVTRERLITYGFGDGGGGPQFEMIELARRLEDLNGIGKVKHTTVGDFMKNLENNAKNPSCYKGELYLELHRGTLTNQHEIKRHNRKAELRLRDLEYLTVNEAFKKKEVASDKEIHPLYEKLLINQFHDILPGTCIHSAHVLSLKETGEVLDKSKELIEAIVNGEGDCVTVTNTLSFDRNDAIFVECPEGLIADIDAKQQRFVNLDGKNVLAISGITVPAFSSVSFKLVNGEPKKNSEITFNDNQIDTPFADIKLDERGFISSFYDKRMNRQLKGEGYNLGAFIVAEDLPLSYDNWDVDADYETKFKDSSSLISSRVVSCGEVCLVIRNEYQLTKKSSLIQDVYYFADSAEIRYDTLMNWNDDHRFLKTCFDTSIKNDFARFEIQFGNVCRPTTRNNSIEKAKFEVCNHKFTDLSETRQGVAILNDSKYAISVDGGQMRLSLHKGGNRPDTDGDHGMHRTVYSFLPHTGSFSAEEVIRPAYELNIPVIVSNGEFKASALIVPDKANIIVESIKPCEDNERAFIARLYEAEGTYTNCALNLCEGITRLESTNMLEEVQQELKCDTLSFRPFEIKTLKLSY